MKEFPDKYFDLAIVDPPYGGAIEKGKGKIKAGRTGGTWASKYGTTINEWDIAPGKDYVKELFRVSKNQIIWGGNYFDLPPTRCFIVWKKTNIPEQFTMSMVEYAWTSFDANAKLYEKSSSGTLNNPRFHPTQKPVDLYKWILGRFAKEDDKILDTHVGSGSSMIAAYRAGFDAWGFEINEGYYQIAYKRLEEEKKQITIWEL